MVRTYSSFKECTLTWHKILVEVMLGGKSKPCLPLGAVFSRIADVDNREERRPESCTAPEQPSQPRVAGRLGNSPREDVIIGQRVIPGFRIF